MLTWTVHTANSNKAPVHSLGGMHESVAVGLTVNELPIETGVGMPSTVPSCVNNVLLVE